MVRAEQIAKSLDEGLNDQIRKLYNVLQTNLASSPIDQRDRAFHAFVLGLRNAVDIHDELSKRLEEHEKQKGRL